MPYEDIKNMILEVDEDMLSEALIQVTWIFSFLRAFLELYLNCFLFHGIMRKWSSISWLIELGMFSCVDLKCSYQETCIVIQWVKLLPLTPASPVRTPVTLCRFRTFHF